MTQVRPSINLPPANSLEIFNVSDPSSSDPYVSSNSNQSSAYFIPPLKEFKVQPQFLNENSSQKQTASNDLSNVVRKKVKYNPEISSRLLPSWQEINQTFSNFDFFPSSNVTLTEPMNLKCVKVKDNGISYKIDNQSPKETSRNLSKKPTVKSEVQANDEIIFVDCMEEKPQSATKTGINKVTGNKKGRKPKKKDSIVPKKSIEEKAISSFEVEQSVNQINMDGFLDTISPSTRASSSESGSVVELQVPTFVQMEGSGDGTSKQLYQALQSLQFKMLDKQSIEGFDHKQGSELKDVKLVIEYLANYLKQIDIPMNLDYNQVLTLLLNEPCLNELLVFLNWQNSLNLLSFKPETSHIASSDISTVCKPVVEDKRETCKNKINNLDKNQEITIVESETDDDNEVIIVNPKDINDNMNNKAIESTLENKLSQQPIEKAPRITEIDAEMRVEEIKAQDNEKNLQESKDKIIETSQTSEIIQNETKENEETKAIRTKNGTILISKWSLASERRKNRWQLSQECGLSDTSESKKVITKNTKECKQFSYQEIYFETPVGSNYQAEIPAFQKKRNANQNKRFPKLKWSPTSITKKRLEYYFKALEEIFKCNINEERAIKLLKEGGNDPKKVYKLIEGKEKEYMREFIIRPRRKP